MHAVSSPGVSSLIVALGLAACAPRSTPVATPHAARTAVAGANQPADAPADARPDVETFRWTHDGHEQAVEVARVTVLDPGHGDRQQLRLGTGPATDSALRFESTLRDRKTGAVISTSTVDLQVTLGASADQPGIVLIGYTVRDVDVTSSPAGAPDPFDGGERVDGKVMLSPRGQRLGSMVRTKDPAVGARAEELARLVAATVAVPLPDEPVGEGARWRVREIAPMVHQMKLATLVETTYTLEQLRDGVAVIKTSARRLPLVEQGHPLTLPGDSSAAAAARDRAAHTSMLDLSRGIGPIGRDEGVAIFPLGAPSRGTYARATKLEVAFQVPASAGDTAPGPMVEADLVEILTVGAAEPPTLVSGQ